MNPNAVAASRAEGAGEGPRAAPGRQDLEAAVQRLSVRQQSHDSEERSFFEAERERKLRRLRDGASSSGFLSPEGSVLSAGTNHSGGSELTAAASSFSLGSLTYFPDKLQIVKPLEGEGRRGCRAAGALRVQHPLLNPPPAVSPPGSVTLHHWQQLAQPNLGGILVPRPGVLTKDFRQLDTDLEEVYSLNDLEEDDVDAGSFQLLPTSTPAKAKERPRGERGLRGRRGRSPRGAPVLLPRLALASPVLSPLAALCPRHPAVPTGIVRRQLPRRDEPSPSPWRAPAVPRLPGRGRSGSDGISWSRLCPASSPALAVPPPESRPLPIDPLSPVPSSVLLC